MILTIGMIVKNEEKHLQRCLEALLPILQQLDSELVIVDTGSTDKTFEIASQFTDRLYSFDWCSDFSAARNFGLEKARGEWFMAIDADEILEDTNALIGFFTNGDYHNFNMATYIQRSPRKEGGGVYSDLNVLRLVKRTGDLHYSGAIHEQFCCIREPIQHLPTVAYHYGYIVSENDDFINNKIKRNLEILLSDLRKNPCNSMTHHYLYQVFYIAGQFEEAEKYARAGLEYAKLDGGIRQFAFYRDIALSCQAIKKYKETLETIRMYFNSRPEPLAFDLDMYYIQGYTYFDLLNDNEAIAAFEAYTKFYGEYKQGLYHGNEILMLTIASSKPFSYREACYKLSVSYLNIGDIPSAQRCLGLINTSDWLYDGSYMSKRLALELKLMERTGDFGALPAQYQRTFGPGKEVLEDLIKKEISSEYRGQILREFSKAGMNMTLSLFQSDPQGFENTDSPDDEMIKYSMIIKNNIRRLVVTGQMAKAKEILLSYVQLCPDDTQITDLKSLLL